MKLFTPSLIKCLITRSKPLFCCASWEEWDQQKKGPDRPSAFSLARRREYVPLAASALPRPDVRMRPTPSGARNLAPRPPGSSTTYFTVFQPCAPAI